MSRASSTSPHGVGSGTCLRYPKNLDSRCSVVHSEVIPRDIPHKFLSKSFTDFKKISSNLACKTEIK